MPAAVASLAYLNARWSINNDWRILSSVARSQIRRSLAQKKDRVNVFYSLEGYATSPKTAALPFLVYEGKTWSFSETYDTVLRYAAWLHHGYGVKSRDIVALDFMNCPEFVFLWLALWSLGATPAFINHNLMGNPLVHSIRVSTTRLLILDPEIRSVLTPEVEAEITSPMFLSTTDGSTNASDRLTIVNFTSTIQSSLPYQPRYRAPDSARSKTLLRDAAILIYTSGTTGLPKPAISSWTKIHTGGVYAASWMGLRPATHKSPDRFYCCMPLYHASGSVLGFSTCLINGTAFILGHRFSTRRFWNEVRDSDATILQYVGETCRYLLSAPAQPDPRDSTKNLDRVHKIRLAFGNGLRPDVWDRFKDRFGIETIGEFYAATEGTSGAWNYSSNSFASGAVGRSGAIAELLLKRQNCIVKVDYATELPFRDPDTGLCTAVPRGEPGELLYALDASDIRDKFQGYFNNAEASSKKVLRDVVKQGDAWFRTGDIMRWDTEGRVWFVDRIGDTFRWKSENVSTAEVAQVLGSHPSVAEANVYGVELPGFEGRAGCAAIVLRPGGPRADADDMPKNELMADLATYATNSLPSYSVPLFIRLVAQMQATGTMKQQKQTLRSQGVHPATVHQGSAGPPDEIWWLKNGGGGTGPSYVRFGNDDWDALVKGKVKL